MPQRQSTVAGSFYPANPDILHSELQAMLRQASSPSPGETIGLLVPHAGYVFSGGVAAKAYRQVQDQSFDAIVVVGPSHRLHLEYSAVYHDGSWLTPLGEVQVAESIASAIVAARSGTVRADTESHMLHGRAGEHSLEVQLPFLQEVLPGISVVPIMMGMQSPRMATELALAITEGTRGHNVLLVASSDLSHFHSDTTARLLDERIREAVKTFDPAILWNTIHKDGAEACGAGPIAAVMEASRLLGAEKAVPLAYATSADVPQGSKSSVVGYLAAAFVRGTE